MVKGGVDDGVSVGRSIFEQTDIVQRSKDRADSLCFQFGGLLL
jgi:hypothetical protein